MLALSNMPGGFSLPALKQWVEAQLRSVQTQVSTVWNVEHKSDGTHGDVTATSVRTPRLRLRCRPEAWPTGDIFVRDASGASAANGLPLEVPEGVMWVSIIGAGGGSYQLFGIRQQGVQFGDRLYVRRDPHSAGNIELRDRVAASVPAGTEIHVPQDVSLSYPSFFLVNPCWLPLIYTPGAGTGNANGWALLNTFSA